MKLEPSELVVRFVRSIGRPAEAEYYLSLFRAARPESFAIIAASENVLREAADALVVDLRFLSQLGLHPTIALGLVQPRRAREHAEALRAALQPRIEAHVVAPGDAAEVARRGGIALVPFAQGAGIDDRFDRLTALATGNQVRKVVFLGRRSGLQPRGREPLSLVDLTTEYDELAAAGVLTQKQAALLAQVRRLIDGAAASAHRLTVSVTSPFDLLRELFTVRGAGTLVRRGSAITRHGSIAAAGPERLQALIEAAFGRRLGADFLARPVDAVYLAGDGRGAAVVIDTELGGYLSKFAVDVGAQGEGVGRDLWRALARDYRALFWRSRNGNAIAAWYGQQCDGLTRTGDWTVYWRGLEHTAIPRAIELALTMPIDFEPREGSPR
jgi:ribosomal protein S18 acetylase RimI-like enzyme